LFGLVRGTIIIGLLLFLLNFFPLPFEIEYQMRQSILAEYFIDGIISIYNSLKEWLPSHFQFEIEFIKERFYQNIKT